MQATSVTTNDYADCHFDHDDDLSDLGGAASRIKFNAVEIALLKFKRLAGESRLPGEFS